MTAPRLRLYAFFHLNMAYSSIEEEQRPDVVQRCYWPLLRLVRDIELPVGIEASAYTLECIRDIDPGWVIEFASLCSEGLCELVGSGYVQLIGPLVPPEVNVANLRLGNEAYEGKAFHRIDQRAGLLGRTGTALHRCWLSGNHHGVG